MLFQEIQLKHIVRTSNFQEQAQMDLQSTLAKSDTSGAGTKCPSYRESNKGSKERQGATLGAHLIESQIKGVKKGRDQL